MAERTTIHVDQFLRHPPAKVWRALVDPALLARWLAPNDFEPRIGHCFTLDMGPWGTTRCEVLELQVERLLRISWLHPPLDTTVTWRLEPEGRGTRLFVEHAGFDPDDPAQEMAFRGMSGGWATEVAAALAVCLDQLPDSGSAPAWSAP